MKDQRKVKKNREFRIFNIFLIQGNEGTYLEKYLNFFLMWVWRRKNISGNLGYSNFVNDYIVILSTLGFMAVLDFCQ